MDKDRLDDALQTLTRRDLERMQKLIEQRLRICAICGVDGAQPYAITTKKPVSTRATILICRPCFEKHRLPINRLQETS